MRDRNESFHARLCRLRENRGLTQKKVARIVGVPESTYRNWEYGGAIRGQPYVRLAQALEVGLSELLVGSLPRQASLLQIMNEIEVQIRKLRTELIPFL